MGEDFDIMEVIRGETNLLERIFGGNVSADPNIFVPIFLIAFFGLVFIALRIVFKDKGKSEMTEDELEKDRSIWHDALEREAALKGRKVNTELLMQLEAKEIEAGKRISGKE